MVSIGLNIGLSKGGNPVKIERIGRFRGRVGVRVRVRVKVRAARSRSSASAGPYRSSP